MIGRYKSRKFILAASVLVVSTWLLVLGFLDASNWVTINSLVANLYFGANVVQKIMTKGESSE